MEGGGGGGGGSGGGGAIMIFPCHPYSRCYCAPAPPATADGMDIDLDLTSSLQLAGGTADLSQDQVMFRHTIAFLDEENVERDLMLAHYPDVAGLEKFVFRLPAYSAIVLMICCCMESGY